MTPEQTESEENSKVPEIKEPAVFVNNKSSVKNLSVDMSLIQVGGSELAHNLPCIQKRNILSKSMMTNYEPQAVKNLSELKIIETKNQWMPKKVYKPRRGPS